MFFPSMLAIGQGPEPEEKPPNNHVPSPYFTVGMKFLMLMARAPRPSFFSGCPNKILKCVQLIQNAAVCLLTKNKKKL